MVHPFQRFVVLALGWAAFGPYLAGSVRTEQLAVYGLAAVVLPLAWVRIRAGVGWRLLAPWLGLVAVAALGVVFPSNLFAPWEPGNAIAGFDNLLLPVAVMLLVWGVVTPASAPDLLRSVAKVVVWLTACNAVLAVLNAAIVDLPFLKLFWGEGNDGSDRKSTAFYAAELGRYSGIFNQPAEAGVMYGVAALLAIYVYQRSKVKLGLALTLITVGGLLCVSKVFILGGIPLIIVYIWRTRTLGGKAGFVVSTLLILGGVAQSGLLSAWTGFDYLTRLFSPGEDQGLVEFYTAGRWNEGSSISSVMGTIWELNPISGVGAAGWKVPYDSGWTDVLVVGGLLGAAAHAAVILGLFVLARRTVDPDRRRLTFFFALFMAGADLGIPAFTANRVATVVWVVIALLVLASTVNEQMSPAARKVRKTGLKPMLAEVA